MVLLRKMTCNLRHPKHLRHPVSSWLQTIYARLTEVSETETYICQKRPIYVKRHTKNVLLGHFATASVCVRCICIHMCTRWYTAHMYLYLFICTHMCLVFIDMYTHVYTCFYLYVHTCVHVGIVRICTCIFIHMYTHVYTYMQVYVCVSVCTRV